MILGVTKQPLTPTWLNVAYYYGAVAIFTIVIGLRFLDLRRDMIRRGERRKYRAVLVTALIFFAIAVGYGIPLIVRTANS